MVLDEGKYFVIKSLSGDFVLDCVNANPGSVCRLSPYTSAPTQLWYEDALGGGIRSRADDALCLQVVGETVRVERAAPQEYNQKFIRHGNRLCHKDDNKWVMESEDKEGAEVVASQWTGDDPQKWIFKNVAPVTFTIRNHEHDLVMDVSGRATNAGAIVILYAKKKEVTSNQVWYEDKYGIIRSAMNDMVPDTIKGEATMQEYDHDVASRQWVRNGLKIVNLKNPDDVLEAKGGELRKGLGMLKLKKSSDPGVGVKHGYTGDADQKWSFEPCFLT